MNIKVSRFLSALMATLLLSLFCVPAFAAADPAPTDSRGNFYDWLVNQGGSFAGDRISGGGGRPSKDGYDNFVSELPAPNINSEGLASFYITGWTYEPLYFSGTKIISSLSEYPCADSYCPSESHTYIEFTSGFFSVPVSGEYTIVFPEPDPLGFYYNGTTVYLFSESSGTRGLGFSETGFSIKVPLVVGEQYYVKSYLNPKSSSKGDMCSFRIYRPYIIGSRSAFSASTPDAYNINTRPTAITGGNYGIVGDDNQIITVTNNNKIVNETNNTYYNPATGQTSTITDWSYNYDGRIYDITLDTGDTVQIEYGDQNITITENNVVEGDTIVNNYTIYYIVDGSGGETHTHDWVQTGARQGTCLTPAQRTYTCTVCNEQYTETDTAPGHSWRAIRTVPTTYDEDGNLTQEGYTIYECERCDEQYKSTNITGPPASGGGSSGGGSGSSGGDNIFSGIFGIFWDFCSFMFDFFSEFVLGGIKGFIANLLDAGSDFFSILNPFSWDY